MVIQTYPMIQMLFERHNLLSGPNFRCCLQGHYHLHIYILSFFVCFCSYPLNVSPKRPGKGILELYFPLLYVYLFCLHNGSRESTFTIKCHQTALWQSLNADGSCKENYFATTVAKHFFLPNGCLSQIPQHFSKCLPLSILSPTCFRGSLNISFVLNYCSATARCYNYCISSFSAALLNSLLC